MSWTHDDIAKVFPTHPIFKHLSVGTQAMMAYHFETSEKLTKNCKVFEELSLRVSPIEQVLLLMWQRNVYSIFLDLNALHRGECNN